MEALLQDAYSIAVAQKVLQPQKPRLLCATRLQNTSKLQAKRAKKHYQVMLLRNPADSSCSNGCLQWRAI